VKGRARAGTHVGVSGSRALRKIFGLRRWSDRRLKQVVTENFHNSYSSLNVRIIKLRRQI
jgi:hypothetical protein